MCGTALDPKIAKVKTVRGIHVGSALATARSTYHIPAGGGEAGLSRAVIKGPRNRCTVFYAPTAPYTKIEAIQVGICGAAGLV